jgi:hypothetical protein
MSKRQIISEQPYKNEKRAKKGIPGPMLQTVFLLFKVIAHEPPRKFQSQIYSTSSAVLIRRRKPIERSVSGVSGGR